MSLYAYGKSSQELAEIIDRQTTALAVLEQRAAAASIRADKVLAEANTQSNRIILEAIAAADKLIAAAKVTAERESGRIRERAYLEGRVLADAQRIEHDNRIRGDHRRARLANELARQGH